MTMTMIMLNKYVDSADCCLTGIVLGVTMKKISPNNICEYRPVPNNGTQYQYRSSNPRIYPLLWTNGNKLWLITDTVNGALHYRA